MAGESKFWQLIKSQAPGKWVRIENSIMRGFPDTIVTWNGVTALVELKHVIDDEDDWGVTALQKVFLKDWRGAGGLSFVLALIEEETGDHIFLVDGGDVFFHYNTWKGRAVFTCGKNGLANGGWDNMMREIALTGISIQNSRV